MKLPRRTLPALSLFALATGLGAEVIERVIVKVNGDVVTQSEFVARQAAAVQAARIPSDRIETFLRENNAKILQEAIDELLLVQRASELGYRVPPQYVDEFVDGLKKENNLSTDEDLVAALRREGMTLQDLKRNIERNILRQQVLQRELQSKLALTEADARVDYEARKAEYTKPASVHLQEILVPTSVADAPALASDLARRARGGEDFGDLARRHSQGPSKAGGGDLGRLNRGDLAPDLEKVAFGLAPGAVSDPIETSRGLVIFRCVEKTEGSVTPFEEVKGQILQRLGQARMASQYEGYMEGLRKSALIDLRVREVPLQVTVPPSSLLEPPTAPADPTKPVRVNDEFSVTPQAAPERVAPSPLPTPSPSPPS